jgi:hypothetical protein
VCAHRRPPAAGGLPPPFIGQGEAVYNRAAQFQLRVAVWCTTPWSRRPSWRILLLVERHGWELLLWSSCVRQLEGRADGRPAVAQRRAWRRLVILDSHNAGDGAAVPGMVALQWGWPHRADSDGGDTPHWFDVTASSREGARQVSVPFSRVPPSSFEGAACRPYDSGRHSVTELTLALPHSVVQWRGWPHREGW